MKSGIIIYLTGDGPDYSDEAISRALEKSGVSADAFDMVASASGDADIHYAWWRLMAKGMQRVFCRSALSGKHGDIIFTGRELRLYG